MESLGRVGGSGQVDHRQEAYSSQEAYSRDRGRLLRVGGERCGEETVEAARARNDSWS